MKMQLYLFTSGSLFGLIAFLQGLRLANRWTAQIGTMAIPLWASGIAVVISTSLSAWAFHLARKRDNQI